MPKEVRPLAMSSLRHRVLLAVIGFAVLVFIGPVLMIGGSGLVLLQDASAMKQAVAVKNVSRLKGEVAAARPALTGLQLGLKGLFWTAIIPGWAPTYHAAVDWVRVAEASDGLIEPLLGDVTTKLATASGKERLVAPSALLAAVAESLPAVTTTLETHLGTLQQLSTLLHQLPRHRLIGPVRALTKKWEPLLTAGTSTVMGLTPIVHRAMPAWMRALGFFKPQRYLLLFQNSGEMRATGGFLTAYAVITLSRGVLGPLQVHNIYSLAHQIQYRPPAPNVIAYEFGLAHWHLRDANTSPNVPTTVQTIYRFWNSIPHHRSSMGWCSSIYGWQTRSSRI